MNYFINLAVMLDQCANTILGGYPDETISLRAARARNKGARWGCALCRLLEFFVKDHCDNAIRREHASILVRGL
jgi:hypothetical protein